MNEIKRIDLIFNRSHFDGIIDIGENPLDIVNNVETRDLILIILVSLLLIISGIGVILGVLGIIWYAIKIFKEYHEWLELKKRVNDYYETYEKYKTVFLEFENNLMKINLDEIIIVNDLSNIKKIIKHENYLKIFLSSEDETFTIPKKSISTEDFEFIYSETTKYMKISENTTTTKSQD